jgi:predicted nucleic acid-binding Zn ribbon protein
MRDEFQPRTLLAAVQATWAEVVGEAIAAAARPVAERDGVVTVACVASTWAQELDLMGDELLAKLGAHLDRPPPTGLRFVTDGGRYADRD